MLLISYIQNLIQEIQNESDGDKNVNYDNMECRKDIFFRLNDNIITATEALAKLNENAKKFGQKDSDQIVKL